MDWLLVVAYLGSLVVILLIIAVLLYAVCYFYSASDKDEPETIDDKAREAAKKAAYGTAMEYKSRDNKNKLMAAGKQTMVSTLVKSANDKDVVIATAISSIPLRELGGKNNDIIVDVSQQMYLDKDLEGHDEHQCIVCSTRKDIAWSQVSCYAQTTIGVLVYKRTPTADQTSSSL